MSALLVNSQASKSIVGNADEDIKSKSIESYYKQHGVKFPMRSNYMLNVFTLMNQSDKKLMVRVMDDRDAPVDHVSYVDYINNPHPKPLEANKAKLSNRCFTIMKKDDETSNLPLYIVNNKGKRFFGKLYDNCLPIISPDNNIICMPRFSNATGYNFDD